jgi:hypothetical protein
MWAVGGELDEVTMTCEQWVQTNNDENSIIYIYQRRLVGVAIGGLTRGNGWNGINGSELNVVTICLTAFHVLPLSVHVPAARAQ